VTSRVTSAYNAPEYKKRQESSRCEVLRDDGVDPVASLVIFGKIVIRWKGASSAASRSLHDARPATVVKDDRPDQMSRPGRVGYY
jgi:hypothetical protein